MNNENKLKLGFNKGAMADGLQYLFMSTTLNVLDTANLVHQQCEDMITGVVDSDKFLNNVEKTILGLQQKKAGSPMFGSQVIVDECYASFTESISEILETFSTLREYAQIWSIPATEEMQGCNKSLNTAMGNISYCLLKSLGFLDQISDISVDEDKLEVEVSPEIKYAINDSKQYLGNVNAFVRDLVRMYQANPSVKPISEEFPEVWDDFVARVSETSEYLNNVLDYQRFIYFPDMMAVLKGIITPDETFIEKIKIREMRDFLSIVDIMPVETQEFMDRIPEDHFDLLLEYFYEITPEMVKQVNSEEIRIDDRFIRELEERKEKGNASRIKNAFTVKGELIEETNYFEQ